MFAKYSDLGVKMHQINAWSKLFVVHAMAFPFISLEKASWAVVIWCATVVRVLRSAFSRLLVSQNGLCFLERSFFALTSHIAFI